jgi:hypothetical protein
VDPHNPLVLVCSVASPTEPGRQDAARGLRARARWRISLSAELAVEVDGGADQREVGERLGEVAELLAGGSDFFGVEAEVVGVGEHLVERETRVVEAAGAGERFDVPEAADREGALVAAEPVGEAWGL